MFKNQIKEANQQEIFLKETFWALIILINVDSNKNKFSSMADYKQQQGKVCHMLVKSNSSQ